MKKDEYRIVEHHYKFYIEVLVRFLWWQYYVTIKENTNVYGSGGNVKIFETLEDAKKFIEGCEIKYHKI